MLWSECSIVPAEREGCAFRPLALPCGFTDTKAPPLPFPAVSLIDQAFSAIQNGDMERGAALLQQSAEAGNALAAHHLGRLHLYGMLNASSREQGLQWLHKGIEGGDVSARFTRALLNCGSENPAGTCWFEDLWAAARAGHPLAWRSLALLVGQQPDAASQGFAHRAFEHAAQRNDPVSALLLERRQRAGGQSGSEALPRLDVAHAERTLPPLPPGAPLRMHENVLTAEEAAYLQALAAPLLRPSTASDPLSGSSVRVPIRTSLDAQIDPLIEDAAMRLLQRRLCSLAGLPSAHAEPMVVLRYRPGQEYRPHRDILPPSLLADPVQGRGGQRTATVISYLNAVDEGGETDFPRWGQRIAPKPGAALVFNNLRPDGQVEDDSLHSGLPVTRGEKWIATLWIREKPLRSF